MTRLVIMVKSKIFKGYSIILNRQCYRSLCVDVMMLASLFCYLFIYLFITQFNWELSKKATSFHIAIITDNY